MTIAVSNHLGGEKTLDPAYQIRGLSIGSQTQFFTGISPTRKASFQFDFKKPTHCLLENDVAEVLKRTTNCTVFPISFDQDITTVSNCIDDPIFIIAQLTQIICA